MLVAPPLDSIYSGEFEPGAEKDTDDKIEDWLRNVVASDNHEVGSLSMMPQSLGGVVDTSLKVYGTANVRVAGVFCFSHVSQILDSELYRCFHHPIPDQRSLGWFLILIAVILCSYALFSRPPFT